MAFKKIQPEQLQMPTFFSDLGDIKLGQTATGIKMDVSRNLTGTFHITGDLYINRLPVVRSAETGSNTYVPDDGGLVINGEENWLVGTDNICINGSDNDISGNSNISLNGNEQFFGTGTLSCLGVGGMATFPNDTTGSVIFTDSLGVSTTSYGNNIFNIDFDGGTFLDGGDVVFQTNLTATTAASGLFSGDFSVLGDSYLTGYKVSTTHDVTGLLSGENFVNVGAVGSQQTVVGQKKFTTGILHAMPYWRDLYNDATTMSGQFAMSGENLIFKREDGTWTGIAMQPIP